MIQSHTTTDILTNGINQAIMHGAPPDVIANTTMSQPGGQS